MNRLTYVLGAPCFHQPTLWLELAMTYEGFAIECYEAGKGLWHARLRRADRHPVLVGGVSFSTIEIGFAWPDQDSAAADAKNQIDRLKLKRYATTARTLHEELTAA